jgi:hypothetical protein
MGLRHKESRVMKKVISELQSLFSLLNVIRKNMTRGSGYVTHSTGKRNA